MSQFGTERVGQGACSRTIKAAIPALALAFGAAAASPGHATQFFLQSASMNTSRTAVISGPGMNDNTYIAPVKFTTYLGTGATPQTGALSGSFDMVGFCLDIFHHISLGNVNLKYDDTYDLATNSNYTTNTPWAGATLLTTSQITQVGRLVNYGTQIYKSGGPLTTDKIDRMASVQGAIWKTINPGYNVVSPTAAVNTYINAFSGANYVANLTGYGAVGSGMTFLTETGKCGQKTAHQSFGFAGVPEPGLWAVMIMGFGLAGSALRRSRRQLALAAI